MMDKTKAAVRLSKVFPETERRLFCMFLLAFTPSLVLFARGSFRPNLIILLTVCRLFRAVISFAGRHDDQARRECLQRNADLAGLDFEHADRR